MTLQWAECPGRKLSMDRLSGYTFVRVGETRIQEKKEGGPQETTKQKAFQAFCWMLYNPSRKLHLPFSCINIPGDPQKSTPFVYVNIFNPNLTQKCSIFKRNIFIPVFISTKSQISMLHIARDIQHIVNIYLVFLCVVLNF